jgi:hypothetical protein
LIAYKNCYKQSLYFGLPGVLSGLIRQQEFFLNNPIHGNNTDHNPKSTQINSILKLKTKRTELKKGSIDIYYALT